MRLLVLFRLEVGGLKSLSVVVVVEESSLFESAAVGDATTSVESSLFESAAVSNGTSSLLSVVVESSSSFV